MRRPNCPPRYPTSQSKVSYYQGGPKEMRHKRNPRPFSNRSPSHCQRRPATLLFDHQRLASRPARMAFDAAHCRKNGEGFHPNAEPLNPCGAVHKAIFSTVQELIRYLREGILFDCAGDATEYNAETRNIGLKAAKKPWSAGSCPRKNQFKYIFLGIRFGGLSSRPISLGTASSP